MCIRDRTNTGSVNLTVTNILDEVTEYEGGDTTALTEEIKEQIEAHFAALPDGIVLEPGEDKAQYIEIEVNSPTGRHVNVARPEVPALTTTRTVVNPVPGSTVPPSEENGTTVPGTTIPPSFKTETTVVETAPVTPVSYTHLTLPTIYSV